MTLREARCRFTEALAYLVGFARLHGYEVAFAEGMDRVTIKDPTTDHMEGSLHEVGLAQDIDLYYEGRYLKETSDHLSLGDEWERYGREHGIPLRWGGRFKHADGNHYELIWRTK